MHNTKKHTSINEHSIATIKKLVRESYEYRRFIRFLKDTMKLNYCVFDKDSQYTSDNGYRIEVHHHPMFLNDITKIVAYKHKKQQGYFYNKMVAKEIIIAHFNLKVGLTTLRPLRHRLVHDGHLQIYKNQLVIDGWEDFIKEYDKYILDDGFRDRMQKFRDAGPCTEYPDILKPELNIQEVNSNKFLTNVKEKDMTKLTFVEPKRESIM